MTTSNKPAPFRIPIFFEAKGGLILLDQIRALDKQRLVRRLGVAEKPILVAALQRLREMFEE